MLKLKGLLTAAACSAAAAAAGLPYRTDITYYSLSSDRIAAPVRALILSDFHNDGTKDRAARLAEMIKGLKPDLILMPGDMAEEHHHQECTFFLLHMLAGIPMYYCTGNHEEFRWDLSELKQRFRDAGVTVLDEKSTVAAIGDAKLELAGISCMQDMDYFDPQTVSNLFQTDHYRILLSHKPNWTALYDDVDCDLTVCGHAHGGQWHIPYFDIPIAAPSQGLFPKYTNGIHQLKKGKMLVSRGMVRHYHGIPRLYNNPEIVVLTLEPKKI